jgi:hypothetical protein
MSRVDPLDHAAGFDERLTVRIDEVRDGHRVRPLSTASDSDHGNRGGGTVTAP